MKPVTLITGDGIGIEIMEAVKNIFKAAAVPIIWEEENAGKTALETKGALIPESLINSLNKTQIALKGPLETPVGKGFKSVNVQLRQQFDLYANIRPCRSTEGITTKFENVDLVIFRENTEGLYSGINYYDERLEIADSISRVTKKGSQRIIQAAFEYAHKNKHDHITVVHKANILKNSGRLMLEAAEQTAQKYPHIRWDDRIVDNMAMQLVRAPEQFDIIVTSNLFGDILSDLCAGLVGGLGVVAGANIGDQMAIFEAVHGTAPDIAGKGIANPTAVLRSALLMLEYMELYEYKEKIDTALNKVLKQKELCTGDLGGKANTLQFAQHIIDNFV
ncbi:MAG: isocitrate/isopropylmalate dehydrogenase family protein [Cytophagales bacterium]|nr:MAG: isocitrate/isopropylmalate dehydrogenase family protein [Cytophagales bacterium]